jgi:hypothetical protein
MEAGDPLPLKEGAPTHLAPIKGQVHNTLWLELIPPPTADAIFALSQHTGSHQTHQ